MKLTSPTLVAACAAAALTTGTPAFAAPFYGWQNEYTGNEANTLALYNFEGTTGANQRRNNAAATSGSYNLNATTGVTTGPTVAGKFGQGLDVVRSSSADSFMQAASSQGLFPPAPVPDTANEGPSLTVELWANFDDRTLLQQIIDKQFSGNPVGFQMDLNNSVLKFSVGNGTSKMSVTADLSAVLKNDTWYHLAGTWNAADDTLRLYMDGTLVGSAEHKGRSIVNSGSLMRIGNRLGSSYYSFDGQLDGVRISSVAYEFAVPPIPEPASLALLGAGTLLIVGRRRR